jgi:serine/threonine protein kinase
MPSDSQSKSSSHSARCSTCGEQSSPSHVCKNPFEKLLGTTIDGRYEVKSILGQGGMGVVFAATQTSMKRDVALKMLHPSMSMAPAFADRFRREAEVVSRLKHPNIISIFDFGQTQDGAFYYTMEMLEGDNLKALVKRDGPMSISRAVELVEQIGEALGYAHSEGILHRDMKPHNVMCARYGGRDRIKVLDFGLVKMVDEENNEEHLTTTGQILGTPAYMSPEQAAGDPLDARSDLYSLGVVLYYLLAGSTPYKASSAQKMLQMALSNEVPAVATRRVGAAIPAALEIFFRRALAFEKEDRPADIEAFLVELRATLAGVHPEVLDAVPTGATQPVTESKTLTGQRRSTNPGSSSRVIAAPELVAPPSSSKAAIIGASAGAVLLAVAAAVFFLGRPGPTPVTQVVVAPVHSQPEPVPQAAPTQVIVSLESEPSGAQLFQGDKLLGTAPTKLAFDRNLAVVTVTARLMGYLPQTQAIDLSSAVPAATLKLAADPAAHAKVEPPKHVGKKSAGQTAVPIFE